MTQRKPLKSIQIKNIRHREQVATRGPWLLHEQVVDAFTTDRVITTEWANDKTQYPEPIISISQSEDRAALWIEDKDAAFIVGARDDIPQLLSSLDVFGHRIVYDALLHYFNNRECTEPQRQVLEQAIETCWQIINAKSPKV